ncbi:Ankyrin-3-like protein 3 [Colletotrichum kahawae]|uniref:Ankyrin-3-like protein 3 n=1 Tax=Colletotrichum kahawae TaxID=34407 RepID=A0AAE0D6C0_COLKA|nr:Ankyrin-3-like protein 3 [Colletotrichum kahawae]
MALGRRRLTCFIGALDECSESEVRQMIVFFEGLEEEATSNNIHLKTCFSSRHYPHIDIKFGLKLTLEDQYGHGQDLQRYVEAYLRVGDRAHADTFRSKILQKAGGVFMWVVLVVEILNKEFVRGRWFLVEQRLQQIPTELSKLFKDIIIRDNNNMDEFSLCCQWILFAKRPLNPKEFYFAMRSGLSEGRYSPVMFNPEFDTQTDMELFVTSSSKGLAEITTSSHPTVQFIHESIRDFLIKDNGLQELWPELGSNLQATSHEKLKECCQLYVTPNMVRLVRLPALALRRVPKRRRMEQTRRKAMELFPFLEYATENLLHHANIYAATRSQRTFLETLPFADWVYLTNLFTTDDEDCFKPTSSLTYVLAEKNFAKLLEERLRRWPVCDIKGESFGYPIFAALAKQHWPAAMVLLGRATDPFPSKELPFYFDYRNEFGRDHPHPLHWAIQQGAWTIVRLMIDSGYYDCSTLNGQGFSSVHLIAVAGPLDILRQLMDKILASHTQFDDKTLDNIHDRSETKWLAQYIDARTKDGLSPLWYACSGLNEAAIRQFLDWGADSSVVTTRPVKFADLSKLNISVAELLIERGFASKRTFLHAAIAEGLPDVIDLIIDDKALFNEPWCNGESLLAEATSNPTYNWREVVGMLIQKGAWTVTDKKQWSCGKFIAVKAAEGNLAAVKDLAKLGTWLKSPTDMPMHKASVGGHRNVVKCLLDNGVPVDLRNEPEQDTALHEACANGKWEVVQLLLKRNADSNAVSKTYRTPLHLAAKGGHEHVVKVLLFHEADVNAKDNNGKTPVAFARVAGHNDLVKHFKGRDARRPP